MSGIICFAQLAQAPQPTQSSMSGVEYGIVGMVILGLLGLIVFIVRHALIVTLPEIQKTHTAVVEKIIDKFAVEQKEARTLFREEASAERTTCERRHAENLENSKEQHKKIGELVDELKVVVRMAQKRENEK